MRRDPYLFETQYGSKSIELVHGDITALDVDIDVLTFSAFCGSYAPTRGTIIRALMEKGTDVRKYALKPELDLRSSKGVWMSSEISNDDIKATRLACLEIPYEKEIFSEEYIKEQINSLFGMIAAAEYCGISVGSIAIPLFGGNNTDVDHDMMLSCIMEESKKALKSIRGFEKVVIVVYSGIDYAIAEKMFDKILGRTELDSATFNMNSGIQDLVDSIANDIGVIAKKLPSKDESEMFQQLSVLRNIANEKCFIVCIAARKLLEMLVNQDCAENCYLKEKLLLEKISTLNKYGKIPKIINSYMHVVRIVGNCSAHADNFQQSDNNIDKEYKLSAYDVKSMLFCLAAVLNYYRKHWQSY